MGERRRALRVPVRGNVVVGGVRGTIENLSSSGALLDVGGPPAAGALDVELKLGSDTARVSARAVRIERTAARWRIAVAFDGVDSQMRAAIETAIAQALRAAQRRPILVIDDRIGRRADLVSLLAARGMTPLAARTPLEAIDLLTRTQLHVNVCCFGDTTQELRALVADSFPWVTTAEISDDLEATVDRAVEAWSGTEVARIAAAIS